jgi:hypothetical protein
MSDGGAAAAAAAGGGLMARRAMSMGQLSSLGSQKELRPGSTQSSAVFDAQQERDSDTRSVRSAATSHASGGAASGHLTSPLVVPPWKLSQQEYWISLKGIVFRMNPAVAPPSQASASASGLESDLTSSMSTVTRSPNVSSGRMLYYRLVLLPIYSGRDVTTAFAWLQRGCSTTDYLTLEPYVAQWRVRLNLAQQQDSTSPPTDVTPPSPESCLGSPASWPDSLKERINSIFELFLHDFEVVGELENGQDLWF